MRHWDRVLLRFCETAGHTTSRRFRAAGHRTSGRLRAAGHMTFLKRKVARLGTPKCCPGV